jgi:hypothetical protein
MEATEATTAANAVQRTGFESFTDSFFEWGSNVASQALAIQTAGWLNDMKQDNGLAKPSIDQPDPVVGPGGDNRTPAVQTENQNLKTWLMIGGGLILFLLVVMVLLGGRR